MRVAIAAALAAMSVAACSVGQDQPQSAPVNHHGTLQPISKVLVVVEENHSYAEMGRGMPFLDAQSHRYGYATDWHAITHPSEPNYLAMAGGSTFGIADDDLPAVHEDDIGQAPSVFDRALAAGKTARLYAESMPSPCYPENHHDASGTYVVRHNPWAYFAAGRSACGAHEGGLPEFAADVSSGHLPNVAFLIPNLEHDAHDGSLAEADAWLKTQLSPVLAGPDFTSGRLVVVITADEDDEHSGNVVLTSVLNPRVSNTVVDVPLDHYSLSRYLCRVLGIEPLAHGRTAADLGAAFHL